MLCDILVAVDVVNVCTQFYEFSGSSIDRRPNNFITMWHVFAEYVRYGSFSGSVASYGHIYTSIVSTHYIVDVLFFVSVFIMWNIVKGEQYPLVGFNSNPACYIAQESHSTSLWRYARSL